MIHTILGYEVTVDPELGTLTVEHDGSISWNTLQKIKNVAWGENTRAIEVYPKDSDVVDNGNYRHLWKLGDKDFCPNLLGVEYDSLAFRFSKIQTKSKLT